MLALLLAAAQGAPAPAAELDFTLPEKTDAALFTALLAHAGAGVGGWRVLPFRRLGNFVEARWCAPGVGPAACDGGAVVNDRAPGTAWRQLATLGYDAEWPRTFGVVYSAGDVPVGGGWGATVWLRVNGKSVVGDGFEFSFMRVDAGEVQREIGGGGWAIDVGARHFALEVPDPCAEALAMVQGRENFAATASMRLNALLAQVRVAHAQGALTVWREGPYLGGGLPPERVAVPATVAEADALLTAAAAQLTADRDTLVAEAAILHPVLARLLPARPLAK